MMYLLKQNDWRCHILKLMKTIVLGNAEDHFVVCSLTEKDVDKSIIDDEKWYA